MYIVLLLRSSGTPLPCRKNVHQSRWHLYQTVLGILCHQSEPLLIFQQLIILLVDATCFCLSLLHPKKIILGKIFCSFEFSSVCWFSYLFSAFSSYSGVAVALKLLAKLLRFFFMYFVCFLFPQYWPMKVLCQWHLDNNKNYLMWNLRCD